MKERSIKKGGIFNLITCSLSTDNRVRFFLLRRLFTFGNLASRDQPINESSETTLIPHQLESAQIRCIPLTFSTNWLIWLRPSPESRIDGLFSNTGDAKVIGLLFHIPVRVATSCLSRSSSFFFLLSYSFCSTYASYATIIPNHFKLGVYVTGDMN